MKNKSISIITKKMRKLPTCRAFVDFEHWYISLERRYQVKPDLLEWAEELKKNYRVEEIAVFADFSATGIRAELEKIRDITNKIFDTKNSSVYYKKDFTDFIMLDYIYQSAIQSASTDTFILFTGDGHFNSVARFLKNQCGKSVGIYAVTGAVNSQLKTTATWVREIPSDTELFRSYCKMLVETFDYIFVHKELNIIPTENTIVEIAAKRCRMEAKPLSDALSHMLDCGYVYPSVMLADGKNKKCIRANWDLLARDKLWSNP